MRNIIGPVVRGLSEGLEAAEARRRQALQEARDKALFVENMRRAQLVNAGMEAEQAAAQAQAEATALFMREVEAAGMGGAGARGGGFPGAPGGAFPGGPGGAVPGGGFGAAPGGAAGAGLGAAPTLPRLDLQSAITMGGVAPALRQLFAAAGAGGGGGAPLGPGGPAPTTPTGLARLPAMGAMPGLGVAAGGAAPGAPQLPLLMPGFGAGGRPGAGAMPSAGPAPGTHPKLLQAWARWKAATGELTPEDMVTAGLLSPEQMPRGWQAEQGYRMTPAQEAAADAKARADAAATISEAVGDVATWISEGVMGAEEARSYLEDLGLAEEARAYGLPYSPPPFGESPKAVRAWADAAQSTLEAGYAEKMGEKMPTGETALQEEATRALTAQRYAGAALTGARRAWGPGGGAGGGREPITLTSVNVEVNRLRNLLSGGWDSYAGEMRPGMEEGPERDEIESELAYWQQYRELLGGPPVAGAGAKGGLGERAGFGVKSPEKLKEAKTGGEIHAFIRDKGPVVYAQEAGRDLGYSADEIEAVLGEHLPVISPEMIARVSGKQQTSALARFWQRGQYVPPQARGRSGGETLPPQAPGGGWSLPGQSGYPAY